MEKIKKKIFNIIQIENDSEPIGKFFDIFIAAIIFINLFITFFLTFEESEKYKNILINIENITIIVFLIEYVLRIWTANFLYPNLNNLKSKIKFMTSFFGIIDLLTFLPYIVPIFFPAGMIAFRLLRVIRIFHLFRINKSHDSFSVIVDVLKEKKNQIISATLLTIILMFASSLCIYHLEHNAQPDVFKNAFSGLWWSVSAILTVGYGDIYPITFLGKIFAIIISILGVGIVAIPTGIIASGFYEKAQKIKKYENCLDEHSLKFISTIIDKNHIWKNKLIKELYLPKDFIIATIERNKEIIIPNGNTKIEENDRIIIGAKNYKINNSLELKEIIIKEKHPWKNKHIKELDISRQTILISIKRKNNIIIPSGDTIIKDGDIIIVCRKNDYKNEQNEFYI